MTTIRHFSFSYGDRSPRGFLARIFAIVWVLVGLVITSIFTGVVTTSLTAITLSTDVKLYGAKVGFSQISSTYFPKTWIWICSEDRGKFWRVAKKNCFATTATELWNWWCYSKLKTYISHKNFSATQEFSLTGSFKKKRIVTQTSLKFQVVAKYVPIANSLFSKTKLYLNNMILIISPPN